MNTKNYQTKPAMNTSEEQAHKVPYNRELYGIFSIGDVIKFLVKIIPCPIVLQGQALRVF